MSQSPLLEAEHTNSRDLLTPLSSCIWNLFAGFSQGASSQSFPSKVPKSVSLLKRFHVQQFVFGWPHCFFLYAIVLLSISDNRCWDWSLLCSHRSHSRSKLHTVEDSIRPRPPLIRKSWWRTNRFELCSFLHQRTLTFEGDAAFDHIPYHIYNFADIQGKLRIGSQCA